ncbi:hypothetical protein TWF694_008750 [Orbilia ellipsospora]|uniref:Uncharacterized protein n=1 Tax=Orbilia ellipsospora TaxID=2528407 RepID=A0AAV9XCV1_9PEZI
MSEIISNDSERGFISTLFNSHGKSFNLAILRELDIEAYNRENDWNRKEAEKDACIEQLRSDLETARDKLKKLQNSRFKSVERESAIPDSKLSEDYDELIGEVKSMVVNLTKAANNNIKNVLRLLAQSKQYQEGLTRVLEPNVSVQQFVELLEKSDSPTKLLAFVMRAIIMNMLRLKLFNSNVFMCLGGESWKQLRGVYRHLLAPSIDQNGDEPEVLVAPGDDRLRKDASLWRSQTLITLSKNKERLALNEGQAAVIQRLTIQIEDLLSPLVESAKVKGSLKNDIRMLVEYAAHLSIQLGRQRAMFEMEPKRYLGPKLDERTMEPIGPWAIDSEEDPTAEKPTEILAVVVPALYKFGNDDGEEFDRYSVLKQAQVLVLPPSFVAKPISLDTTASALAKAEEIPTADEEVSPISNDDDNDGPKSSSIDQCHENNGGQASINPGANAEIKPPVPPKDQPTRSGSSKIKDAAIVDKNKALASEFPPSVKTKLMPKK